jgi:predicted ester cyclase
MPSSPRLATPFGLMSTQENKTIVRRILTELYNQGNLAVADEVFADHYVEHHPLPPDYPTGREAVRRFVAGSRTAFPDLVYTIEDAVAEADMVVMRVRGRGTHRGAWELLPVPPTGKSVTWTEMHFCRMAGGQLVEHWPAVDQLGLLQQLGAIPVPA